MCVRVCVCTCGSSNQNKFITMTMYSSHSQLTIMCTVHHWLQLQVNPGFKRSAINTSHKPFVVQMWVILLNNVGAGRVACAMMPYNHGVFKLVCLVCASKHIRRNHSRDTDVGKNSMLQPCVTLLILRVHISSCAHKLSSSQHPTTSKGCPENDLR